MQRVCWMTLKCSAEPKRRDVTQIAVFEAEPVPLWLKDKIHPKWQESGFRYWAAQKYAEILVSNTRFSLCPAGCVLWYSKLSDERYSRMAAKYEKRAGRATAIRQHEGKRAGRTRTGERGYSTFAGRTQGVLQYGNTYAGGGQ